MLHGRVEQEAGKILITSAVQLGSLVSTIVKVVSCPLVLLIDSSKVVKMP